RSPEPRPGGGLTPLQTQDPTQSVSRELIPGLTTRGSATATLFPAVLGQIQAFHMLCFWTDIRLSLIHDF
ncbi:MAG: hypothetical protein AAF483_09510, partial [Planctomycetota bacterium]